MSCNWLEQTRISRLKAAKFLTKNAFPSLDGQELTSERNKINEAIRYAVKKGELEINNADEFDVVTFFRWASEKKITKRSAELRWPWLEKCLNLPRQPITGGGTLLKLEQVIVPSDIQECQQELVKAWRKNNELQNQVNPLLAENKELKVKRNRREEAGKHAAKKQWNKE